MKNEDKNYWLIIATSGRMLAQAAKNEGFATLVIDCFADVDTFNYAKKVIRVDSLTIENLTFALSQLNHFQIAGVVYGSGFENHVESLYFLEKRFVLAGNSATVFERVQNKRDFFSALDDLKISYPQTRFSPPKDSTNWLTKPLTGQGGVGINSQKTDIYWQQFCGGKSGSVLFLNSEIVGFNTQWTHGDFLFSGISNHSDLSDFQKKQLGLWVKKLATHFNLRGLNSLDFIHNENEIFVLEINSRPPASMQLYDLPFFSMQSCVSEHPPLPPFKGGSSCAYQIIYAPHSLIIPQNFNWSENCHDLPQNGVIIRKNLPICSMIARGMQPEAVLKILEINVKELEGNLKMTQASVNKLTKPLVQELITNAAKLRVGVEKLENGCTIIDAGINHVGGLEAGRIIAEICLGGMGTVSISHSPYTTNWPLSVNVHTGNPVLGCLGSQYAGWSLSHEKYYALGSGPARAMATKQKDGQTIPVEELYQELAYHDDGDAATLVIENDAVPPLAIVEKVAAACGISPEKLTIIVTPTSSLAGGVQVVARVLEVAMHKAHALHFPLENIVDGSGSAPICPPHPNFVKAMGRTNDAILFAGQVHLFVKGSDEAAEKLAKELPSSISKDYGKPFADIFKAYEYDFFKIDAMLFSPASVIVTAVESGKSFRAGKLDNALLDLSFGA
ncbi:MAG: methenyltetrahydromethanopterin cyclohydrolase [Methylococcales bacterium]|nr:methenyltetrahydromethanopterin cyclohydrolase [Methylococcales bacterium]